MEDPGKELGRVSAGTEVFRSRRMYVASGLPAASRKDYAKDGRGRLLGIQSRFLKKTAAGLKTRQPSCSLKKVLLFDQFAENIEQTAGLLLRRSTAPEHAEHTRQVRNLVFLFTNQIGQGGNALLVSEKLGEGVHLIL